MISIYGENIKAKDFPNGERKYVYSQVLDDMEIPYVSKLHGNYFELLVELTKLQQEEMHDRLLNPSKYD